ncbi:hypothetical protein Bbelb_439620 [Branchiostoma belcheri]|nr:hypothetical protein Bbelb_439900 [Branchiostoma belcheri]KAI8478312.1 hypothetical protein Bbelb_439620 [Branchiostoma belcheri]
MAVSPVQSRSLYKTFRSGKGTGGAADGPLDRVTQNRSFWSETSDTSIVYNTCVCTQQHNHQSLNFNTTSRGDREGNLANNPAEKLFRAPSETSLNNRVAAKTNIGNTNGNVGRRKILPGTSLGNRGAAACTIGSGGTCRTTS